MRKITSICKSNQALKKDVLVRLEGTLECLTSCSTELQRIAIHVILSRPVMPYLMCCHFQCTLFYPARQAFYVCCARRISVRLKHSSLQHCDLNDSFPKSQHSHRHCITAKHCFTIDFRHLVQTMGLLIVQQHDSFLCLDGRRMSAIRCRLVCKG